MIFIILIIHLCHDIPHLYAVFICTLFRSSVTLLIYIPLQFPFTIFICMSLHASVTLFQCITNLVSMGMFYHFSKLTHWGILISGCDSFLKKVLFIGRIHSLPDIAWFTWNINSNLNGGKNIVYFLPSSISITMIITTTVCLTSGYFPCSRH